MPHLTLSLLDQELIVVKLSGRVVLFARAEVARNYYDIMDSCGRLELVINILVLVPSSILTLLWSDT